MKNSSTNFRTTHRRFRRALLAGVLLLPLVLADRGFALDPGRDLLQYNYQTWSRQNGLPANGINAIAQTKDGYLCFGTAAGLLRFDGIEFKQLDLHSVAAVHNSTVTSLASDRSGGVWVGLQNSAFGFYDGRSFTFHGGTNAATTRLDVRSILEGADGTLWVVAAGEVARMNRSGALEPIPIMGSDTNQASVITCGYEDPRGWLWLGTANQGVYCWRNGKIAKIADPKLDDNAVLSIAEDWDGQIWVGTSLGLYCYDSKLQRKEIPPIYEEVRALLVDRQGVLWIGTTGHGLARYRHGTYDFLQKADGLGNDYVNAIAEDKEGSLWVGTRNGISQISDVKFPIQHAAEDPTVKDALTVAPARRGGVWIASGDGGVARFDPKAKTYTMLSGLTERYAKRVFEARNGDVYVVSGTSKLVVFSGGKAVATNAAPSMVVGMAEDEQGVLVSVGGALYRAGTNYFRPYTFTNAEQPQFWWILNLAAGKDGVIWVASANGIFRVKDGTYQHWAAAEGLADPFVETVCEDQDGVVWAGLQSGIARLKDNQIRLINRQNGLFDDSIFAIVPDDLGNLWVDSSRGFFRVARQSMNEFADGKTNHVEDTVFDGINSVKVADKTQQERVGCKTDDGRIWFPSPLGVVMIDPANITVNNVAPPVHIEHVRANGKELGRSGQIVVPPGNGELEFHFDALSFIAPSKVQIQYRLEGYDQDWVDAGDRRLAFYTNLKPGTYTFQVIAANADGIWNEQGDTMAIRLRPHYYQTLWFRLLCGVLALAALGGSYAWRVRHLMHKQQALQKARDLLKSEVASRTRDLATANASLQREEAELKAETRALAKEIEERKRMQLEIERIHQELLETSRRAGMAEVATGILHNVGNVLNSVNIASSCVADSLRKSKAANLSKVVTLLRDHEADLGGFLTTDAKGKQIPGYLAQLAGHLAGEQADALKELAQLQKNIEHIKDIVTMQQSFAKASGVTEIVNVTDLVEDALKMNLSGLTRHEVKVVREFKETPPVTVQKHKVLQILVNLVSNAKHACEASGQKDKQLTVRTTNGAGHVRIAVCDNGIGIAPENLTRIFAHGFTTKEGGHGFGLHRGALAAKELGGSLTVHSDGSGKGATFTLELPVTTNKDSNE